MQTLKTSISFKNAEALRGEKNRAGFTLIELMISLVVLAFGILGFLFLQGRAVQGRVFAREMSRATFVAQSNMEELLSMDFSHALLSAGTHPTAGEGGINVPNITPLVRKDSFGNFNYFTYWKVISVNADIKTIVMRVTWQDKDPGRTSPPKLELTTIKSK